LQHEKATDFLNNYSKHQLDIVTQFDDLESGAKALARSARSKGSRDDITVLLTEITADSGPSRPPIPFHSGH
jgi:serine/threonine protein phosphatase PrpC